MYTDEESAGRKHSMPNPHPELKTRASFNGIEEHTTAVHEKSVCSLDQRYR